MNNPVQRINDLAVREGYDRYAAERGQHEATDKDFRMETAPVHAIPATPNPPGSESVGPVLFDLVRRTATAIEVQHELIRAAIPLLNRRTVINYATGTTDANGNLDLVLYRVPQGMQYVSTRVNVEDATHNPGNAFQAATAWIALCRGDKFQPGSILDFAPNPALPAASSGTILPIEFSDGPAESSILRGGEIFSLHIFGTAAIANTDIWVRIQGFEEPL